MQQLIIGFDQDDELHWRAMLACGHYQHLRHDPPLTERDWILSEKGRKEHLGFMLECRKCDERGVRDF